MVPYDMLTSSSSISGTAADARAAAGRAGHDRAERQMLAQGALRRPHHWGEGHECISRRQITSRSS